MLGAACSLKGDEQVRLYTIGFAGKSARRFFGLLEENKVSKVVCG